MPTPAEIQKKGQETLQAVLQRSATDAEFRSRLLTDPRTALAEYVEEELPANFNVAFIENQADATFVLPDAIDPEAELSESELETVAGGAIPWMSIYVTIMGTMAISRGVKTLGDDDAWLS